MLKRLMMRRAMVVSAALLASAVVSAGWAAVPAVLTEVPGDAYGVAVINNVRTLANRLSNAATRLNIPAPPDLIGFATRNLGITKGFDANSSLAVVFLKPSEERLKDGYFNGPPIAVILVPTSDAQGMLTPLSPGAPDAQGISQVTLPTGPDEKGYVAVVAGKWVALAQSREDLVSYLGRKGSFAKTASPETLKVFDTNDLVIWGNVEKLGAGADKFLDERQTELSGMMELANVAGNQDAVAGAVQKQAISSAFSFAKEFLSDTSAAMITARITDSGATVGLVGDFKAGTPMGKFVAGAGSGAPVSLKGLPGGNFLAAGSMKWDGASVIAAVDSIEKQFMADPAVAKDPRGPQFTKLFEEYKQMMGASHGMSMVLLDPPAGGKEGIFCGSAIVEVDDPQKYVNLQIEQMRNGLAESLNPAIKQTVTVVPDAATVKNVKLTKATIKMEAAAGAGADQAQQMVMQITQRMYGPEGLTVYMGVVGKRVVTIFGSDPGTMEAAVSAAQGDADALATNAGIVAVKDQVVANPVAVAYLPITRWIALGQAIVTQMMGAGGDQPAPAAAPAAPAAAGTPPVVMSAGVSGQMMTAELHVPIATILGVQEAVQKLQRAVGGGAGLGQPALP